MLIPYYAICLKIFFFEIPAGRVEFILVCCFVQRPCRTLANTFNTWYNIHHNIHLRVNNELGKVSIRCICIIESNSREFMETYRSALEVRSHTYMMYNIQTWYYNTATVLINIIYWVYYYANRELYDFQSKSSVHQLATLLRTFYFTSSRT